MAHENRRFSRIQPDIEAQMTVDNHHYSTTRVINLGIGGCLLGIMADLRPGTACSIQFFLGNADAGYEIRVDAEVIRGQPEGIAFRFTAIDPDSLFHLQNLVRFNAEDPEAVEQEIREHPGLV